MYYVILFLYLHILTIMISYFTTKLSLTMRAVVNSYIVILYIKLLELDHMERKVPKYGKYWKGKGKLLPKIEEISGGKAHTDTQKLIQNIWRSQMSFLIRRE